MSDNRPSPQYDMRNEEEYRRETSRQLKRCYKKDEDFIILSPNKTPFKIVVSDAGVLSAAAV